MKRLIFLIAGLAASAALAQPQASQPQAGATQSHDPNAMVCQRVQMLGSRLNVGRVCMTRLQWEQRRQADRMDAERAQTRRIVPR